jgi:uncharacterized protein YegL
MSFATKNAVVNEKSTALRQTDRYEFKDRTAVPYTAINMFTPPFLQAGGNFPFGAGFHPAEPFS